MKKVNQGNKICDPDLRRKVTDGSGSRKRDGEVLE